MRVLVTGASGFVGRVLLRRLAMHGHAVVAAVRRVPDQVPDIAGTSGSVQWATVPDLSGAVDWAPLMGSVDGVVHLAGVAHVLDQSDEAMTARYMAVNRDATFALARAAAEAGVRRFVFMSSVRVYGDAGSAAALTAQDACVPADAYGRSKLEAERGLALIARESGLEAVVLRPPLVYGPGVRANFLRLVEWVDAGRPLPFGAIRNRRSLIGVDNLAAAVGCVLEHPLAAGGTFLPSDGEDVSTPDLIRRIARALGRRPLLLPVPGALMHLGMALLGKGADYRRLFGSVVVDPSTLRDQLGYRPVMTLDDGLRETVAWYRAGKP